MNILFIVGKFPVLSETFILNQITGLINRGHKIDIFAAIPGDSSAVHTDVDKYSLLDHAYYSRMPDSFLFRLVKGFTLLAANGFKRRGLLLRSLNLFKYGRYSASMRLLYDAAPMLGQPSHDIIHCHFGHNGNRGGM